MNKQNSKLGLRLLFYFGGFTAFCNHLVSFLPARKYLVIRLATVWSCTPSLTASVRRATVC